MAPVTFKTVYLFFALVALPQVLAGPACASRHYGKSDCVGRCKSHWGYGGNYMGHDKWGSVISSYKDQNTDPDSVLSTACGLDKTATPDPAAIPTDLYSCSSSEPPPPVTGITPTPSELPSDLTPSSSPPSSPSPTTTFTTSSTSTPPPPPATSSPPHPVNVAAEPSPSPSSSEPSTPPATPSSIPNDSGTDTFSDEILAGHNTFRATHGADPLTWNQTLADLALKWASKCVLEHSGGELGPFGENLAAGVNAAGAIKLWTDEEPQYDPANPVFSHFTQVVWKGTKQLGCATHPCPGSIIDWPSGTAQFVICEYYPAGNVLGEFPENVQKN